MSDILTSSWRSILLIKSIEIMKQQFTPENIGTLKENGIFVFGSNLNGDHAGGAARTAVEKFGAFMGQAESIQGHIRFIR